MELPEGYAEAFVWYKPGNVGQRSLPELLGEICAFDGIIAVAMWSPDGGETVTAVPMCHLTNTQPNWWPAATDEIEMLEWLIVFLKDQRRRAVRKSN